MTNVTLTKPDKKLEDGRELGLLYISMDVSKNKLERIEIKIQNSEAETKRLKKNLKKQIKKTKKYEDVYKNKWELFKENYGKFRQLKLI